MQEALLEKQEEEEKLQLQVLQKKQHLEEEEQQHQQDDDEEEGQVSSMYFPVLIFVDVIVQCMPSQAKKRKTGSITLTRC